MNFRFESLSRAGVISQGITHAPSLAVARNKLSQHGEQLLSLRPTFSIKWQGKKLNNRQLSEFFSDISVLLNSGVSFADALETLATTTTDSILIKAVTRICSNIAKGYSFSVSMQEINLFPEMAISTVNVGEASGNLGQVMGTLGNYYSEKDIFTSGIKRSMTYPAVILTVLILFFYVAGFWVLPQLITYFENIEVPRTTKALMFFTKVLRRYWYIFLTFNVLLPFAVYIAYQFFKDSSMYRWIHESTRVGRLFKDMIYSTVFLNLGLLSDSGMALTKGITLVSDSMSHYIAECLGKTKGLLDKGMPFSEALSKQKVFSPYICQSVKKGEAAGELGIYLKQIAEFYLRRTQKNMDTLSQIIQPVMLLFIGFAVAVLASAIFMPVYRNLSTMGAGKAF